MKIENLQIALFFKSPILRPDIEFKSFIEKFNTLFDLMPTQIPIPNNAPLDIPLMILNSSNNLYSCNISKSRIDFITSDIEELKKLKNTLSYIDEIANLQQIINFGFVTSFFEEENKASQIIKNNFLCKEYESIPLKEVFVKFNKPITLNEEIFNYHFSVSEAQQQNLISQETRNGILMQKDINNIGLNFKNEIFVSSKLQALFKEASSILFSSSINA